MPYYRRAAKRPRYGSATSTLSSRKHRWQASRRTIHRSSTSFLLQLLKACARSSTSRMPDAGGGRWQQRRKQPLLGVVYVPQGTTAGSLNIATAGSYQDLLSISRNLNDGDRSLSSSVLLLMGGYNCLSLCALCYHSQLNSAR